MFSIKMRTFGNSVAVNGRHNIGFLYTKSFMKNGEFVKMQPNYDREELDGTARVTDRR